jgi:rubredoxin
MTEVGYRKWETVICGFIDDEAQGLRDDWECADCGISRSNFDRMPV